jgi:hypothetical protein
MENLIKQVLASESTKNQWRNKYDSIEFKNATKLNKLLFGIHLNQSVGCQCVEDLFFYIKRKNNFMNKFKLRKGLVVTSFLHATITEHSMDAEFVQALKVSPGAIKYFTEYPENWKDIVSGKEILPSSKEMREQLKEKGIVIPKGTKQPELTKLWQESK